MTSKRAWYSVIQYLPDLDRAEGANVGLLLFAPEDGFLDVRMSPTNRRVRAVFGRGSFDDARLKLAKRALKRRILDQAATLTTPELLRRHLAREGNQLQCTPLREVAIEEPAAALGRLFHELVGSEDQKKRRASRRLPEWEAAMDRLVTTRVPVKRNVPIEVPLLGRTLKADLVFENGKRNVVQGYWFHQDAVSKAAELGTEGLLLAKEHPADREQMLTVVAKVDDPRDEDPVRRILEHHGVRHVAISELPALESEIAREAHD